MDDTTRKSNAVRRECKISEHERWFRREVERGLREADDPSVVRVDNTEVQARWLQQRTELMVRANAKDE